MGIWETIKQENPGAKPPFHEALVEEELNSTKIEAMLHRLESKARGKNFLFS